MDFARFFYNRFLLIHAVVVREQLYKLVLNNGPQSFDSNVTFRREKAHTSFSSERKRNKFPILTSEGVFMSSTWVERSVMPLPSMTSPVYICRFSVLKGVSAFGSVIFSSQWCQNTSPKRSTWSNRHKWTGAVEIGWFWFLRSRKIRIKYG